MASKKVRAIEATEPIADELRSASVTAAQASTGTIEDDPRGVELSAPFVARWAVLISTTNWEKGAIICAWRRELEGQGAVPTSYSDEAWSRQVGGVTSQHVGRLRRVSQRFGNVYQTYPGLYWTHFFAALEWDDAEMWLEGASQSGWSVSQLRHMRWQSMGANPAEEPADEVVAATTDEDFSPVADTVDRDTRDQRDIAEGPRYDAPDFGDETAVATAPATSELAEDEATAFDQMGSNSFDSPFAALPVLPVDVADALEQFKLAIIRHRANAWAEISQGDLVRVLDALKDFAFQG